MSNNNGGPSNQNPDMIRTICESSRNLVYHSTDFLINQLDVNDKIKTTLQELVESREQTDQCLWDEFRETVLLQIEHALFTLHEKRYFHGGLNPSCVLFVEGKNRITLSGANTTIEVGKTELQQVIEDDMKSLSNIYTFVLTNGEWDEFSENINAGSLLCSDPHVAFDLISKIYGEFTSMSEVLEHPYHWSDSQKTNYILGAVQRYDPGTREGNSNYTDKYNKACDMFNANDDEDLWGNWAEKLKLGESELEEIKNKAGQERESALQFDRNKIYKYVHHRCDINKNTRFDIESVFDLMKFFRNRHAHFYEEPMDVQFSFGEIEGYWRFFSGKFPTFFIHVYNRMMNNDAAPNVNQDGKARFKPLPFLEFRNRYEVGNVV